jgi:acyl-coenzyme A thioesterase PaaI-like protein
VDEALQDRYAPHSACFGCGPANPQGLRVKSRAAEDGEVIATWTPAAHHEAFPGMVGGGIIGTLLDCHANWTAAWHLMRRSGATHPPCTVTAEFSVQLRRPTPSGGPLTLRARPVDVREDRAVVEARLEAADETTATFRGLFVAVKPGHPAYGRW